jgi:hypothetical protein
VSTCRANREYGMEAPNKSPNTENSACPLRSVALRAHVLLL